jgi:hypothetical protein
MILLLDSNYRNKELYPYISDFVVPINITPSNNYSDTRSFYSLSQNILFSFRYFTEIENVDYELKSKSTVLIFYNFDLDPSLYILFQNIITGFVIQEITTFFSSSILNCQIVSNGILCECENILQIPITGKLNIINPSLFTNIENQMPFLIYGFSSFNFYPNQFYNNDYGITSHCYLVNLTKNWKTEIMDYKELYRTVILSSYSIDENDYFILLNPSPFNEHFQSIQILNSFENGVYQYVFLSKNFEEWIDNEIFTYDTIRFQWINDELTLYEPGNNVSIGIFEFVSITDINRKITIHIKNTSFSIQVNQIPSYYNLKLFKYLFFFLTEKEWIPFYSYIKNIIYSTHIIFLDKPYSIIQTIGGVINPIFYEYGGFLLFEPILNNLIMPISNPVLSCYRVVLSYISLPNLPVCGYNQLLSFFPFVIVNFGNMGNASEIYGSTLSIGSIISNDPNVVHSNFLCPIANLKNPLITQYIIVSSSQVVQMKLNLQEDLRLQVFLPDGKLLAYSDIYAYQLSTNQIIKTNKCNNIPLNVSAEYKVFNGFDNVYITACFSLSPISM